MPVEPAIQRLIDATPGFMPRVEGAYLHELALISPGNSEHPLVEIGTYCGKSTLYLACAAKALSSTVITIDHHKGSEENYPPFPYFDQRLRHRVSQDLETFNTFRDTLRLSNLTERVMAVVGDSSNYAKLFPQGSAALVFIDGGHSSVQSWSDFIDWSPKLIQGGVLAIHDVFDDPAQGGRPPFEIVTALRHSKTFVELNQVGSLAAFICSS